MLLERAVAGNTGPAIQPADAMHGPALWTASSAEPRFSRLLNNALVFSLGC
jgi:hypothetical protein